MELPYAAACTHTENVQLLNMFHMCQQSIQIHIIHLPYDSFLFSHTILCVHAPIEMRKTVKVKQKPSRERKSSIYCTSGKTIGKIWRSTKNMVIHCCCNGNHFDIHWVHAVCNINIYFNCLRSFHQAY